MEKVYSLSQYLDITGKSMSRSKYFRIKEDHPGYYKISDWMCILSTY